MNRSGIRIIIVMIVAGQLFACRSLNHDTPQPNMSTVEASKTYVCPALPPAFKETDLIGTWMAGTPDQSDTLIINANGTYKQIIHVEFVDRSPIDYESSRLPWRLKYSSDHIGYLHLEGFRFCGMNPGISCEKRDGDGYDICRDETIKMKGEGILLIALAKDVSSIHLAYPLGSEESWQYRRLEP